MLRVMIASHSVRTAPERQRPARSKPFKATSEHPDQHCRRWAAHSCARDAREKAPEDLQIQASHRGGTWIDSSGAQFRRRDDDLPFTENWARWFARSHGSAGASEAATYLRWEAWPCRKTSLTAGGRHTGRQPSRAAGHSRDPHPEPPTVRAVIAQHRTRHRQRYQDLASAKKDRRAAGILRTFELRSTEARHYRMGPTLSLPCNPSSGSAIGTQPASPPSRGRRLRVLWVLPAFDFQIPARAENLLSGHSSGTGSIAPEAVRAQP